MRFLTIALLVLASHYSFAQNEFNKKTANGQKVGEWVEYFENGRIREIKLFKPFSYQDTNEAELFFHNIHPNDTNIIDTVIFSERCIRTDKYEYYNNWNFKRVLRYQNGNKVLLYGEDLNIGLLKTHIYVEGKVDSSIQFNVPVINLSSNPLEISLTSSHGNVENKTVTLAPNDTTIIATNIIVPIDHSESLVYLHRDGLLILIRIATFGYNFCSTDLRNEKTLILENNSIYLRNGTEALLQLFQDNQEKPIKTFSTALPEIKLKTSEIKSGTYKLCAIDYTYGKEMFCTKVLIP